MTYPKSAPTKLSITSSISARPTPKTSCNSSAEMIAARSDSIAGKTFSFREKITPSGQKSKTFPYIFKQ